MFHRSSGEINVLVDSVPLELNFVYARPIMEEGEPSFISTGFLKDDGSLLFVFVPDEIVPVIEEAKSEISVSASFDSPVVPIPQYKCPLDLQCVRFAGKIMEREFNLDARHIKPNTKEPCLNCGVLMWSKNPIGHIAVITKIESGSFEIIEQNFLGCGIIGTRSIEFNDRSIRGYLLP